MKRVIILGATGGIGAACAEIYAELPDHEVWGVARTARPQSHREKFLQGDLQDESFRAKIAEMRPQIVVAAYGSFPSKNATAAQVLNEFALSVIDLFEKCDETGALEDFVVLSSLSAQITSLPHVYMSETNHFYIAAKRFLSDFFRQTMLHMRTRTRILLVEPGIVKTKFADIEARALQQSEKDFITRMRADLMEPSMIAEMIYKNTSDPKRFSKSVTVYNRQQD